MDLVVGQNTYITVEDCEDLLKSYYGETSEVVEKFSGLTEADKKANVYRSFIDMQRLPYRGKKENLDQKTAFPRVNRYGYKSDDEMVKLAQALNTTVFVLTSSGDEASMEKILSYGKYGLKSYRLGSFYVTMEGGEYKQTSSTTSKSGLVEEVLKDWLRGSVPIR